MVLIVRTCYDGTIRSSAILQTQSELRGAIAQSGRDYADVARTTLVQTETHVMTIERIIAKMRDEPEFDPRTAALARQATDVGLPEVAAGLLACAKQLGLADRSRFERSPSPANVTRTASSEARVYQF